MKNLKSKTLTALALIGSLIPLSAFADEGLFVSIGANYAQFDDDFDFEDVQDQEDLEALFDDSSVGVNVGAGWRFNNWLAIDAGYWDLGEFKSDRLPNGGKVDIDTTTFTVGGMVSVPLWILDVYAKGGAAFWDADSDELDDDGTDLYYGVGAALNIFSSIDLYLEIVRFDLQTDIDTGTLGVRFTF
ncbi:MAG: outer membrane beta-barrel protein [Pseudomonadota bacterium]